MNQSGILMESRFRTGNSSDPGYENSVSSCVSDSGSVFRLSAGPGPSYDSVFGLNSGSVCILTLALILGPTVPLLSHFQ